MSQQMYRKQIQILLEYFNVTRIIFITGIIKYIYLFLYLFVSDVVNVKTCIQKVVGKYFRVRRVLNWNEHS